MKFPYAISDFRKLITKNYFYCDRTDRISELEERGDYLLFIRPRRFGKSLLLSTLENYYDVAGKDFPDDQDKLHPPDSHNRHIHPVNILFP